MRRNYRNVGTALAVSPSDRLLTQHGRRRGVNPRPDTAPSPIQTNEGVLC